MDPMRAVEEAQLKREVPDFQVGDTVEVRVKLQEGERERTQAFTGTVISRKGTGIREAFTVRRIVQGEGVERVFPLHSPFVADIKVLRQGRVRRAKLNYLRRRVGKGIRVKERRRPPKK
jgi:large subunit ribosomal protein L19